MRLDYTLHATQQAYKRGCPEFSALPGNARRISSGVTFTLRPDPKLPGYPSSEAEMRSWELNLELRDSGIICETPWERWVIRKRGVEYCLVITGRNRVLTTFKLDPVSHQDVEAHFIGRKMKQAKLRRMEARQSRYDELSDMEDAEVQLYESEFMDE